MRLRHRAREPVENEALARIAAVAVLVGACAASSVAQTGASKGEWPTYGGDLRNTRYSALDQINASNFDNLEIAWRFKTDSLGPTKEYQFEGTPLMVNGVLYTTAGSRRDVVALDAATGEELWIHGENEGERAEAAPRKLSGRGLAYWTDGKGDKRIIYVTIGYRLVCLDAKTGAPIQSFGEGGIVDLKKLAVYGTGQPIDLATGEIGLHAAPAITKSGVVLVGSAFLGGGGPKTHNNTKGMVLAFDVRTGKKLWQFNTIPRPGEFGNDTWLNNSWAINGKYRLWGADLGGRRSRARRTCRSNCRSADYYGGLRPGNGLFGETLVAVDLKTGKRKWHYQLVHHGIWDMDIPIRSDADRHHDRRQTVKAVAQPTKQCFLYVFDRVTGQADLAHRREARASRATCPASGIHRRSRFRASRPRTTVRASLRRLDRLHAGTPCGSGEAGFKNTRSDRSSRPRL